MHDVHSKAFVPALILAPLLPALPAAAMMALADAISSTGLAIVAIAVMAAVVIGGPIYLTIGAVVAWQAIRRFGPDAPFAAIGFTTNLLSSALILPAMIMLAPHSPISLTGLIVICGCIFAPLWAAIGGALYRKFLGYRRPEKRATTTRSTP